MIQQEREQYAPPELKRTASETFETMARVMRRHEAEQLATQQTAAPELPVKRRSELSSTPLAELAEAGADHAATTPPTDPRRRHPVTPAEPDWRALRSRQSQRHDRTLER